MSAEKSFRRWASGEGEGEKETMEKRTGRPPSLLIVSPPSESLEA